MEGIQRWSGLVCVAALGCTAIQMLCPKGGLGKVFRLVTVTFFLCCLAVPLMKLPSLSSLEVSLLPPETVSELLEGKVTEQLHREVQQAVTALTEQALQQRNLTAKKIEVKTDTAENGSIYIKQVVICVDKQSLPIAALVQEVLEVQLNTLVELKTD